MEEKAEVARGTERMEAMAADEARVDSTDRPAECRIPKIDSDVSSLPPKSTLTVHAQDVCMLGSTNTAQRCRRY